MALKTEQFSSAGSNLSKTIGQSWSMISGKDVPNYSLLFLDPTISRKRGEHETIFMPHIVLGRSSKCHVRYSDQYRTVSREHASITVDGNRFIINHNPIASNPTYVNGNPIGSGHELRNGDEIQLSSSGPKIRFNTTAVKSSTIGITSRIGQAMSQATKPYRTALGVMTLFLVGAIALAIYSNNNASIANDRAESAINEAAGANLKVNEVGQKLDISLADSEEKDKKIDELTKRGNRQNAKIEDLKGRISNNPTRSSQNLVSGNSSTLSNHSRTGSLASLPTEDVYYIYATRVEANIDGEVKFLEAKDVFPGEKKNGVWGGTGFLTEDNLFITARHVVQPWRYPQDEFSKVLSFLESKGGKLSIHFEALSQKGDKFTFTTDNTTYDDSKDRLYSDYTLDEDGNKLDYTSKIATDNGSDWAFIKMNNRKGSIKLNRELSKNISMGQPLVVLGYSYSLSLQPKGSDLKPLLSNTMAAQNGITNGVINTTQRGFGPGNSGGPVFIKNNGRFEVIGIVATGTGSEIGGIVPISNLW